MGTNSDVPYSSLYSVIIVTVTESLHSHNKNLLYNTNSQDYIFLYFMVKLPMIVFFFFFLNILGKFYKWKICQFDKLFFVISEALVFHQYCMYTYILFVYRAIPCQRTEKRGQRRKVDFFLMKCER